MKNLKYVLKFIIVCIPFINIGQIKIDISTGVMNTSGVYSIPPPTLLNPGWADDSWQVSSTQQITYPNYLVPTSYNTAFVTNGQGLGVQCGYSLATLPASSTSGWISSAINSANQFTDVPIGSYFYRMNFTIPSCGENNQCVSPKPKSAFLNIRKFELCGFYGSQFVYHYLVNNYLHGLVPVGSNNISFPISINELNSGQNSITFEVVHGGCGFNLNQYNTPIAIKIEGDITVNTSAITDESGNTKTSFCYGEPIYFAGSELDAAGYTADLYNGGATPVVSISQTGAPAWLNIKSLFETTTGFSFLPNQYKIVLTANSKCGPVKIEQEFSVDCCQSTTDASFGLSTNGGVQLTGSNYNPGTHEWNIYATANAGIGPYNIMQSNGGYGFGIPIPAESNLCYYVTHKVTNICGTNCSAQSVCNLSCQSSECSIQAPQNVQYLNGQLSWAPVVGATSYVIEFTENACCGPEPHAVGPTYSVSTTLTSLPFNPFTFPPPGEFSECFSLVVYAICPDGKKSKGSLPPLCIH